MLAAAASKFLGGRHLYRIWPRSLEQRQRLLTKDGCREAELSKIWAVADSANGGHIIFAGSQGVG